MAYWSSSSVNTLATSRTTNRICSARSAVVVRSVGVVLGLMLIGLGFLIPESFVFAWRQTFALALVASGLAACIVSLLAGYGVLATLFAAGAAFALWQDAKPFIDQRDVLGRTGPEIAEIGRHFVVGYEGGSDNIRELVRTGRVGGIFVTSRNVVGRRIADIGAEIASLQEIRREAGLPPLIVAADQEGGPVSRLSPPLPHPQPLSRIAALPPDQRREAARRIGVDQGAALRKIGVTMDLAPVSDLMPDRPWVVDWNTQIVTRSISRYPEVVATVAAGFSEGLLAAGITPTAKHFPGLGRITVDTHLFSASLDAMENDLATTDWVPFREVLGIPGAAVMLSHVALAEIDPGVPVSQSKRVVNDILRKEWGFDGIAITDDLTMGPIQRMGLCKAVERALNAGIDLLLVSWDVDKTYPALRCALDAFDAHRLDDDMLKQSAQRLDRLEGTLKAKPPATDKRVGKSD
jgi:beta-N-acetylhexosaminidase